MKTGDIKMDDYSGSNFLKENNARHLWHPMTDPKVNQKDSPMIISKGEGEYIWDVDGNKFLDVTGGLWNVNVGHNRKEVKEAIVEQLDKIAYYNTFINNSNPPAIELSTRLMEMLKIEDMGKVMFGSGGSDANETALKLARQYWKLMDEPQKTKIFSLKSAYHGVQFGVLSASGGIQWRKAYEPLLAGFFQVDNPDIYRNPWTENAEELGQICADILDREIQHQGPETVAAFIAEPIQGAGGMIIPPSNYWPLIRKICDKHNILLIADEVITGFGRTGSMFGTRAWGVKADIMSFAKGINSGYIPLGATAISKKVEGAWERDHPLSAIMHGYTYSGHPLACAAANANLEIVVRENLPENAERVGLYFLKELKKLKDKHISIGDVRGKGLMLAIEFVKDRDTKEPFAFNDPYPALVAKNARNSGVMIRNQGHRIILSPALTFTNDQVDEAVQGINKAITSASK